VLKNFLSLKGRGMTAEKLKKSVSELLDLYAMTQAKNSKVGRAF